MFTILINYYSNTHTAVVLTHSEYCTDSNMDGIFNWPDVELYTTSRYSSLLGRNPGKHINIINNISDTYDLAIAYCWVLTVWNWVNLANPIIIIMTIIMIVVGYNYTHE